MAATVRFTEEPLEWVFHWLERRCARTPIHGTFDFQVLNPDLFAGCYGGQRVYPNGIPCIHRPYRTWFDLAEVFHCRFLTPLPESGLWVTLRFQLLDVSNSWQHHDGGEDREKYGRRSAFARVFKTEEPHFLRDLSEALAHRQWAEAATVLDLGVNRGDELSVLRRVVGPARFGRLHVIGVDHSPSALALARRRFPRGSFYCEDLNHWNWSRLPPIDLLLSIGTLQSPGFDGKGLFTHLVKAKLKRAGAVILGFPNGRYADGELNYGARSKNARRSDLSLILKDLYFYKRFLEKRGFRVSLRGKYYLFLSAFRQPAVPGGAEAPE